MKAAKNADAADFAAFFRIKNSAIKTGDVSVVLQTLSRCRFDVVGTLFAC